MDSQNNFSTPILFLLYNRLETSLQVFEAIRIKKPKYLYIAADGPKNLADKKKCETVRQYILEKVDWECNINTLFRNKNLGLGKAVSEAITWFFDNVEEGIILEDDTVPDNSFFEFAQKMLTVFKYDKEIAIISGNNFQKGKIRGKHDIFFSSYSFIWGWASWRRSWVGFDYSLSEINPIDINNALNSYGFSKQETKFWQCRFDNIKSLKTHEQSWALRLLFHIWSAKKLTITPNINLVSNVGFGVGSTHTRDINSFLSNMKTGNIDTLRDNYANLVKSANRKADRFSSYEVFGIKPKFLICDLFYRVLIRLGLH